MSTAIASKADSLVEAIGYYYDHPVAFVQDILGAEPEKEQADFLAALVHRKPIAVKSGLQENPPVLFLALHPICPGQKPRGDRNNSR